MMERRMRGAMHRQPWSPAQDEQLREMAKSERDRRVIAKKFGRTSEAVSSRMAKLGLTGD